MKVPKPFDLFALFTAVLLAACASPPAIDSLAMPAPPEAFKQANEDGHWIQARPADAQPRGEWWRAYGDDTLNDLEARAVAHNDRIQIATAHLAKAKALLLESDAQRMPEIDFSSQIFRGTTLQTGNRGINAFTAGPSLSYEADLFGKLSRATDAARLDEQSSEALLLGAQLLVQADVAQTYFAMRALDIEEGIVGDTVRTFTETQKLTRARFVDGYVAELEVHRVDADLASAESDRLALKRQRSVLENGLAVLVGEPASNFSVRPTNWSVAMPVIPQGIPSTVLQRRPDVAAAERELLAAHARVGLAQTAWFPSLDLTANGGYGTTDLSKLFTWSARSWGIGALLALPIFDGGRRDAKIAATKADMDAARAAYREQILVAFKEVEDQLSAQRLLAEQSAAESRAVDSSSLATSMADVRYRDGLTSQFELLEDERAELRSRRRAAQVQAAQYQASVGLIRALGGSWEAPLSAKPIAMSN